MVSVKKLDVCIAGVKVGTLAVTDNYLCAFEYSDEWLMNGYSISPFSLPLEKKVFIPKSYTPFDGLFGIFADSLPDGWGRLLVDRLLMKNKINPYEVDSINRLAIVGKSGMGALEYYIRSIDDRETAWEDYFRLCSLGGSKGYFELLKEGHLSNPFKAGTVEHIMKVLKEKVLQ